jgi:ribonuclease HII
MAPLAGPVVAAAVILPRAYKLRGIDDSKVLDPETRERMAEILKRDAVAWAVGWPRSRRSTGSTSTTQDSWRCAGRCSG